MSLKFFNYFEKFVIKILIVFSNLETVVVVLNKKAPCLNRRVLNFILPILFHDAQTFRNSVRVK